MSAVHQMSMEDKDRIAHEKYGKSYNELSTNEQKAVGGQFRAEALGHEGYSQMSKTQYSSPEEREQARAEREEKKQEMGQEYPRDSPTEYTGTQGQEKYESERKS